MQHETGEQAKKDATKALMVCEADLHSALQAIESATSRMTEADFDQREAKRAYDKALWAYRQAAEKLGRVLGTTDA